MTPYDATRLLRYILDAYRTLHIFKIILEFGDAFSGIGNRGFIFTELQFIRLIDDFFRMSNKLPDGFDIAIQFFLCPFPLLDTF